VDLGILVGAAARSHPLSEPSRSQEPGWGARGNRCWLLVLDLVGVLTGVCGAYQDMCCGSGRGAGCPSFGAHIHTHTHHSVPTPTPTPTPAAAALSTAALSHCRTAALPLPALRLSAVCCVSARRPNTNTAQHPARVKKHVPLGPIAWWVRVRGSEI
jgi:hypothetical protein